MLHRILLILLLGFSLTACPTTQDEIKHSNKKKSPEKNTLADQSGDVSFQSFVGLLRKAAANRDKAMLASMMTANFGYRIEPVGEGPGRSPIGMRTICGPNWIWC